MNANVTANRQVIAAVGGVDARYTGRRLYTVAFDNDVGDRVRAMAPASNVSVSEQIRTLVDWGLEAAEAAP
jgi:hypothetical protein